MKGKVYKGEHLLEDAICIENDWIRVKVLPRIGFKIASIVYKPKNKEMLFQPTEKKYRVPKRKDAFEKYDTSGMDEMLPTIDSCIYPMKPYDGTKLPDHGEVWSMPFETFHKENEVIGCAIIEDIPMKFEKKISLYKDTIHMEYTLSNIKEEKELFLWALHGLNVMDEDTKIILPDEVTKIMNVSESDLLGEIESFHDYPLMDKEGQRIDLRNINTYEDGKCYKFYTIQPIKKGKVGLYYEKENLLYEIKFDPKINPYVGVWITKGGFKGEYNCAIEPTNGFYDALTKAHTNGKVGQMRPKEVKKWSIDIRIHEKSSVDR